MGYADEELELFKKDPLKRKMVLKLADPKIPKNT